MALCAMGTVGPWDKGSLGPWNVGIVRVSTELAPRIHVPLHATDPYLDPAMETTYMITLIAAHPYINVYIGVIVTVRL